MTTRILLAGVFIVAIAVIGYGLLTLPHTTPVSPTVSVSTSTTTDSGATSGSPPNSSAGSTASGGSGSSAQSGYTMAQVAQHNNASSCWSAINGNVYDLTNWINQHPGGPENILSICGADGSAAFNAQHGGQREPAQELAQFYIGALAQ